MSVPQSAYPIASSLHCPGLRENREGDGDARSLLTKMHVAGGQKARNKSVPSGFIQAVASLYRLRTKRRLIMSPKLAAGAAALAFITGLVTAGPASAQTWGCYNGCYPNYVHAQGYNYAPPYGYCGAYAAYCSAYEAPWRYRGGPHPSTGHL